MEDMKNYAYTLFRTIPFLLVEGALFACNRWWEVKRFEGKRKVPDLLM